MVGQTFYPPGDVLRVILGETVPGASFTVGELRLPRAVPGGARRRCASASAASPSRRCCATRWPAPTSSASAPARAPPPSSRIVVLGLGEADGLADRDRRRARRPRCSSTCSPTSDGVVGTRLILIGIGIAAMLDSVIAYVIVRAAPWDLQAAMRWLTGSLNGATWDAGAAGRWRRSCVFGPLLLGQARNLDRAAARRRLGRGARRPGRAHPAARDRRRRRPDRLRDRRRRADRVRRLPRRADRGPDRRRRRLADGAVRAGRRAARAGRRPRRAVRASAPATRSA